MLGVIAAIALVVGGISAGTVASSEEPQAQAAVVEVQSADNQSGHFFNS